MHWKPKATESTSRELWRSNSGASTVLMTSRASRKKGWIDQLSDIGQIVASSKATNCNDNSCLANSCTGRGWSAFSSAAELGESLLTVLEHFLLWN